MLFKYCFSFAVDNFETNIRLCIIFSDLFRISIRYFIPADIRFFSGLAT